ncbi:YfzA family protein [Paenibacillus alvei]|uniref:YfzA family protein n=2 Tax=Paenibacillus alvei TaxID=44250 RepID=A0ABT4E922_PAEAL|nr:YfzA family protein [Paenibacillus alvei]
MPLVGFLVAQLYFIACDRFSWNLYREFKPGTIMGRILNSELFTEWFTPYDLPIFLIVTLLLPSLIGVIMNIFSRK